MHGISGRGLYRQWGIAPRPEDNDSPVFLQAVYDASGKNATGIFGTKSLDRQAAYVVRLPQ